MKIENIEEKYEWKKTNITETDLGWLGRAWADHSFIFLGMKPDLGTSAVVRVIEQCCINSVSDWLF